MNLPVVAALLANVLFVQPNATATIDTPELKTIVAQVDTIVPVGGNADAYLPQINAALPSVITDNLSAAQIQLAAETVIAQREAQ